MGKLIIHIEVDTTAKEIIITDDIGNKRNLQSIVVVGGDYESGDFYLFSQGSASDAGWSIANSYKWSRLTDSPVGVYYQRIFNHFLKWMATFFGWSTGQQISPKDLLEKWGAEDMAKAIEEGKNSTFN